MSTDNTSPHEWEQLNEGGEEVICKEMSVVLQYLDKIVAISYITAALSKIEMI
jgi:hypothetical protein